MISRLLLAACFAVTASIASAEWTAHALHPTGYAASEVTGFAVSRQYGYQLPQTYKYEAGYWTGTANSWISMAPAGSAESRIWKAIPSMQVGHAVFGNATQAGYWTGTSESFVNLAPAGSTNSRCTATDGVTQGGVATFNNLERGGIWTGSAESWVDLHPAGAVTSNVMGVYGSTQGGVVNIGSGVGHAAIWHGTAASWVDMHPAGFAVSYISAVSASKQCGNAFSAATGSRIIMWSGTPNSWVDITPPNATSGEIYAMTDKLQVGRARINNNEHAGVWAGSANSFIDLHALLPAGYQVSGARCIWNDGLNEYIGGYAVRNSTTGPEAFYWTRPYGIPFSFSLNRSSVAGQNYVRGTITLDSPTAVPQSFTTYSNSSLVTTPGTVWVSANTLVRDFQISVKAVTSPINTTVYIKRGGVIKSQPLTLVALVPTSISATPNPISGGLDTTGKVVINGVAGPGGRVVAIFDNSAYSTVPSTVTIPAGASQATFTITTRRPPTQQTVTLTARVSAGEKTGTFRINP